MRHCRPSQLISPEICINAFVSAAVKSLWSSLRRAVVITVDFRVRALSDILAVMPRPSRESSRPLRTK
eukprot:2986125-Prorocentrum_lima.AAC.1